MIEFEKTVVDIRCARHVAGSIARQVLVAPVSEISGGISELGLQWDAVTAIFGRRRIARHQQDADFWRKCRRQRRRNHDVVFRQRSHLSVRRGNRLTCQIEIIAVGIDGAQGLC